MHNKKEDYIVVVSGVPFPYGNASDNAIYTFVDGFHEHGCNGEVLCLYPNLPDIYKDVTNKGVYRNVKYSYLSRRTLRFKNKYLNYVLCQYLTPFLFFIYLNKLHKLYKVHVILVDHVRERLNTICKICKFFDIETYLTVCEYPEFIKTKTDKNLIKFIKLNKYIDGYIFETKTLKNYYKNILQYEIKSIIIPATMPFEDILLHKKEKPEKPYIAYSGSIFSDSKDGLKNIILAFGMYNKENDNIHLKFIGRIAKQSYYKELNDLIISLKLQNYISFTGEVSREKYVSLMGNAELMIVAKPQDSYYGGGLSSKVIEYLFSGNPIIMTKADDYIYYLNHKENVYFTEDNKPVSLYLAIKEVLGNRNLRNKIAKSGKEYAIQHFNYHKLTKELLDFIIEE